VTIINLMGGRLLTDIYKLIEANIIQLKWINITLAYFAIW